VVSALLPGALPLLVAGRRHAASYVADSRDRGHESVILTFAVKLALLPTSGHTRALDMREGRLQQRPSLLESGLVKAQ